MKKLLPVVLLFWVSITLAQNTVTITGTVRNDQGEVLEGVLVHVQDSKNNVISATNGSYFIQANNGIIKITYFLTGYFPETFLLNTTGLQFFVKNVVLRHNVRSLDEVVIQAGINGTGNIRDIDARLLKNLPSVSGNFETLIKTQPGVSPNNELSSEYSVRGGNFDENMVYVNDVEVFRPMLVHSGQQEGLSFINPEMVSRSSFSAGGFQARYGDKLSSVLDVRYGRPDSSELLASAGLTGLSATYKGVSKDRDAFMLVGLRNKLNRNILNSQDVKGSYGSRIYDLQFLAQKDLSPKLSLSLLGNSNSSKFSLVPDNRKTEYGTIDNSIAYNVFYTGHESDNYTTLMSAFTMLYKPSQTFNFKWISSATNIREEENFNVNGSYVLSGLPNSGKPGGSSYTSGSQLNFGTNKLDTRVYSTELRSYFQTRRSYLEVAARYQRDEIGDELNEFSRNNFKTAANVDTSVVYNPTLASNKLITNSFLAFIENTYQFNTFKIYTGIRGNYNSYTREFLISPRLGMFYRPEFAEDLSLRFSAGVYSQPPFYSELLNKNGTLNASGRAQHSYQFLTGADYTFKNSPLTFTSELYYKILDRMIPYKIEDLKIRYLAGQQSKGYAMGADFSLNGEFVNGMKSFFRLSFMKSGEDVIGDSYINKNNVKIEPGYLRRPTDQRISFSIFFQDRLIYNPTYKVHVNVLYGSPLLAGPPETARYSDVYKIPSYKRIDIGFSKDFLGPKSKSTFFKRSFHAFTAYAEIFNILNIDNTVSYLWIRDGNQNQYAVPNYLTSRQLNIKIAANIKYK